MSGPALARRELLAALAGGTTAVAGENNGDCRLFLAGDVMLGRGIDQILRFPSDPRLFEGYLRSALDYVALAERTSGPIPRLVDPAYIWGDLLPILDVSRPDARIINLETSVTTSDTPWPKGINYRMHPANVACLTAAEIDCCVLANNHVLDWGRGGLAETLTTLAHVGIRTAGAGTDLAAAEVPAALAMPGGGRILVFGLGTGSSGIPPNWAAGESLAGVALLEDVSHRELARIESHVRAVRRPGDIVVASIHWGGNWGYTVPAEQQAFARGLIDEAGVDLVHGHSSHHPKPIEVHGERAILYGCGDLLNDYEGISGHEAFRSNLVLAYLPTLARATGRLVHFEMVPLRVRRFRLTRASAEETAWLAARLTREGAPFGTSVTVTPEGALTLAW